MGIAPESSPPEWVRDMCSSGASMRPDRRIPRRPTMSRRDGPERTLVADPES
jgi:hypothetical protein